MNRFYFMGLDNGGSTIKCVIFDQNGAKISGASARVPLSKPYNGFTERDSESVWKANCRVIQESLRKSGLSASEICSVSLCGYGGGMLLLDDNLFPVYPVIVSTDSRADDLLLKFQTDGTDDTVYQYTYQRLWSGQPGMLLPWFSQNRPDILQKSSHVMVIKDYIRYRLTGIIGTERTDASNTNLFNIHTQCFDSAIFSVLGIKDWFSLLPQRLFHPCEIAGHITEAAAEETGLNAGTPVAAGLYDVAACTLASGVLSEDILSVIIGTWSISGHLVRHLEGCSGKNNNMFSFLDNYYFSEESSPTSASNLDWFIEQFFQKQSCAGDNIYEQCNRIVRNCNPEDSDLIFLPYLYGSNSAPTAKASFFNLSGYHTSDHILMAVYEGILFSLLQHIQTLYGSNLPASVRFSGGVSRSPVWCQMLSDILSLPIEVMDCEELGALGSAICASIAAGVYSNYEEAVNQMCHVKQIYHPNPDHTRIYKKKYLQYQKAVRCIRAFSSDI